MAEDLEDQRGQCEEQPFAGDPPPADEYPPGAAVALVFQFYFIHDLNTDTTAAALFAYQAGAADRRALHSRRSCGGRAAVCTEVSFKLRTAILTFH